MTQEAADLRAPDASAPRQVGDRAAGSRPALCFGRVVHDHARFQYRRGLAAFHRPRSQRDIRRYRMGGERLCPHLRRALDAVRSACGSVWTPLDVDRRLGHCIGIRVDGALAAIAGERMRLDGCFEISGVCVSPEHRGKGYVTCWSISCARKARRPSCTSSRTISPPSPFMSGWASRRARFASHP
jgi:hypothetical protein